MGHSLKGVTKVRWTWRVNIKGKGEGESFKSRTFNQGPGMYLKKCTYPLLSTLELGVWTNFGGYWNKGEIEISEIKYLKDVCLKHSILISDILF